MAGIIGSAYVTIRAITDRLESDIERALGPASKRAGDTAGRNISSSISAAIKNTRMELPEIDTSRAERSIGRLGEGTNAEVDVDADTSDARSEIDDLVSSIGNSGGRASDNFISNFGRGNISNYLKRIFYQILWGTPIAGALVGALSALSSGFVGLAAAIAPALSALAVVPGFVGAAVGAIGTIGLAFGGIGKAFTAGTTQMAGAGGAAAKVANGVARANEGAAERIRDAQERAAEVIEDAHERAAERIVEANERARERLEDINEKIAESRIRLAEVYENSSRAVERAQRNLVDSQDDLLDSQNELLRSQRAVNDARKEAADSLVELQFSVEQAAISEGQAAIALERAREKLAEMAELPPDHRLRREAQLQYDQAVLNMKQAEKSNKDLAEEQENANKAGIEGSSEVVRAKEQQAEAEEGLRDAQRETADAQRELADANMDAAKDIADAQKDIKDLIEDRADVEKERLKEIADAHRDLAEAVADAQSDMRESISDANRTLSNSLADIGGAGGAAGGGIDAFAEAMKNLSPEAQEFVRYLISIQGEIRDLRAEAGRELFPKLIRSIQTVLSGGIMPILAGGLREIGSALGDVALDIADLTTDPFFQGAFATNLETTSNITRILGGALADVADYLNTVAAAAAPVTEEFSRWIAKIAEGWSSKARGDFDGLSASIEEGAGVVRQLGRIFGNLWDSIQAIAEVARPAGQILLDAFEGATQKLSEFLSAPGNQAGFREYFDDVATNFLAISGLVASLGEEFVKLANNPAIATIADILATQVVPIFGDILETSMAEIGPQMAETLASVGEVFRELAESGGLEAFMNVIQLAADGLLTLTQIPGFDSFIVAFATFYGTYKALSVVTEISQIPKLASQVTGLKSAFDGMKTSAFVSQVTAAKTAAAASGGSLSTLAAVGGVLGTKFKAVPAIFGKVGKGVGGLISKAGPIGLIVTAIGALVAAFLSTESGQKVLEKLGKVLADVFGTFMEIFGPVFDALGDAFATIGEALQPLLDVLGGALMDILDALMPLLDAVISVFTALLPAITPLIGLVGTLVGVALTPFIAILKAITPIIADLVTQFADWLAPVLEEVAVHVGVFADALVLGIEGLTKWVKGVAEWIESMGGIEGIFKSIGDGWDAAMGWLGDVVDEFTQPFKDALDWIKDLFGIASPSKVMEDIGRFLVLGFLKGFVKLLIEVQKIWKKLKTAFDNGVGLLRRGLDAFVNWLKTFPKKVADRIKGSWDILLTKAREKIDDAKRRLNDLLDWVKGLPAKIRSRIAVMWDYIVTKVAEKINSARARLNDLLDWVKELPGKVRSRISTMWDYLVTKVAEKINSARARLNDLLDWVRDLPGRVRSRIGTMWDSISSAVSDRVNSARAKVNSLLDWASGLPGRMGSRLRGMWDGLKDSFRSAINWVVSAWNNLSFTIPSIKAFGKTIGGITISPPNLPYFADGGTVGATSGGILGVIGEGGRDEVIKPLRNGMSEGEHRLLNAIQTGSTGNNVTINVYAQPGQDVNALAREVSRIVAFNM